MDLNNYFQRYFFIVKIGCYPVKSDFRNQKIKENCHDAFLSKSCQNASKERWCAEPTNVR